MLLFVRPGARKLTTRYARPEATGVVGAALYVLLMTLFAPLPYLAHLIPASPTAAALSPTPLEAYVGAFPHHAFAAYLACLLSLSTATFLGFLDDVFDIRWRFKVPIPRMWLASLATRLKLIQGEQSSPRSRSSSPTPPQVA